MTKNSPKNLCSTKSSSATFWLLLLLVPLLCILPDLLLRAIKKGGRDLEVWRRLKREDRSPVYVDSVGERPLLEITSPSAGEEEKVTKLSSTSECEFPTNLHIFSCYHFQNLGAGGGARRRRRCGGGGGGGGRGRVPLVRLPPPVPHPAAEPLQGAAGVARGRVRLRAGRRVSQEGGGGGRIIAGGGGGILQDDGGREVRDYFLTERAMHAFVRNLPFVAGKFVSRCWP